MNLFNHWQLKVFAAFSVASLVGGIVVVLCMSGLNKPQVFGAGLVSVDRNYMDAFGSAASGTIPTSVYTSSTRLKVLGLDKVVVAGKYTPRTYGATLFLVVERSVDDGQTYYPYTFANQSISTVGVNVNGFTTSSVGVPFQIPSISSTASSTSGTAMLFSFPLPYPFTADYMRVAIKELTTSTAGIVNVQVMSTN